MSSQPPSADKQAPESTAAHHATTETSADEATREELTVQLELLREQNQRLREEYRRAQQQTYRRSAIGLIGVGILAVIGGLILSESQQVLFALGATGLFAGILTYYLTPERFIAATVSEGVFDAATSDREAAIGELGLTGTPVYIPATEPRVYVPDHDTQAFADQPLPDTEALSEFFVTTEEATHGVALTPTGEPLFEEFTQSLTTPLATTAEELTAQLVDGLVEDFELVDGVDDSIDADGGRVTLELSGLTYGAPTRFDHPVNSFVATGLAVGLASPVRVDVSQTDPPVVTYRWDTTPDSESADEG